MTEVTSGYPAPRTNYDPDQTDVALTPVPADDSLDNVEPAAPTPIQATVVSPGDLPPSFRASVSASVSEAGERASALATEAGERASAFASEAGARANEAGERVSAFASDAVDRAGDYAEKAAASTKQLATHVAERLRNNAEVPDGRGTTTISDEVVEKIAGFATREVEGIYDLGGDMARVFASVKERIGLGESAEQSDRGVTVRLEGKNATIKIVIVIEYGYVVYQVTEQVRAKVIASVETLLGLDVTAVDIVVDDIHIDESKLAATVKAISQ
jgi:uncharacterized alkaline shock family protein YloU